MIKIHHATTNDTTRNVWKLGWFHESSELDQALPAQFVYQILNNSHWQVFDKLEIDSSAKILVVVNLRGKRLN